MRLINTGSLDLEEFFGSAIPKYAILSHTWENDEVALEDWHNRSSAVKKTGYKKILSACYQARRDNLEYLWVDTNCIDKKSSAELTEAINSMFAWYQNSQRCYVYLADFLQDTADESVTTHSTKPAQFIGMEQLHLCAQYSRSPSSATDYSLTNNGLSIALPALKINEDYTVALLAVEKDGGAVVLLLKESSALYCRSPFYRPRQVPAKLTNIVQFSAVATEIPRYTRPDYTYSAKYPVEANIFHRLAS
ncbi:hypothetical protein CHU98_g12092 [Xylaria longipes]|nr:hypothetical protein CHU98_g12092 [Xylaria longipes]